ncbi:MAG: HlyC/CorC family transporter [Fibrobacteria bacterium]|nr:HlyC/CorC family transporter [Fibrobacteria bacterium]
MISSGILIVSGLLLSAHFSTVRTVLGLLRREGWHAPEGWERLERRGRKRLDDPTFPVTVSLGRSLGTLLFVLGGWSFLFPYRPPVQWLGLVAGLALLLALYLLGDFFPRLAGRLRAEMLFPHSLYLQEWMTPFFFPFAMPIVKLRRLLERILKWDGRFDFLTEDERARIVDARSEAPAGEGKVEQRIIRGALDLDERRVREILTPRLQVEAVSALTSREDIARRIHETGYSRLPIFDNDLDHVLGVLHAKDLLGSDPQRDVVALLHSPVFVPESQRVPDLLRTLRLRQAHMAMVVDEHGALSGIVTMEDALELIVGEIRDESDEELPAVQVVGGGQYLVQADAHLETVRSGLGRNAPPLPTPPEGVEVDTLAGLFLALAGRIPDVGDSIEAGAWEMTALALDGNRIALVRMTRLAGLDQVASSRPTDSEEGPPEDASPSTEPE